MAPFTLRGLRDDLASVLPKVQRRAQTALLVTGRGVAGLVPPRSPAWVAGAAAERIYRTAPDPAWDSVLRAARIDGVIDDPWAQRPQPNPNRTSREWFTTVAFF